MLTEHKLAKQMTVEKTDVWSDSKIIASIAACALVYYMDLDIQ